MWRSTFSVEAVMDTRTKIIEPERAAARLQELREQGRAVKVVTGYFDVLVADHVTRLREIGRTPGTVFVLVLDPPAPLLGTRARAELVAALAMVDYVVPAAEQAAAALLSRCAASEILREETADLLRAERLSQHVQRRHKQ
jgi:bifunctional ADP-heptose synthase (sugar kinase/adenylyltransferase)